MLNIIIVLFSLLKKLCTQFCSEKLGLSSVLYLFIYIVYLIIDEFPNVIILILRKFRCRSFIDLIYVLELEMKLMKLYLVTIGISIKGNYFY